MINKVHFENFKALRDVTVPLERLTVIVGPNASGKTSILEGLFWLSLMDWEDCHEVFSGINSPYFLCNRQAFDQFIIEVKTSIGDVKLVSPHPNKDQLIGNDKKVPRSKSEFQVLGRTKNQADLGWKPIDAIPHSEQVNYRAALLRHDARKVAEPCYSERTIPFIELDGSGVPSVLAYMRLNRPEEFDDFQSFVRMVIPTIQQIRFERATVVRHEVERIRIDDEVVSKPSSREYTGEAIILDMVGAPNIPASLASEGTLLTIGLLAVMKGPLRHNLLLLDDFEFGLHPKAQKDLVSVIRKLMEQDPELQIIATSHSPYLLDHLRPEEVRLTTLDDDGAVICGSLTDHPDFNKWKDEMAPGEMWSVFGEDWLKDKSKQELPS